MKKDNLTFPGLSQYFPGLLSLQDASVLQAGAMPQSQELVAEGRLSTSIETRVEVRRLVRGSPRQKWLVPFTKVPFWYRSFEPQPNRFGRR